MRKISIIFIAFFYLSNLKAETVVLKGKKAEDLIHNSEIVRLKDFSSIPNYVKFKEGKEIPLLKLESWLKSFYESNEKFGLKLLNQEKDELGFVHYRYQQTINGVPIRFGRYMVHVKNGMIVSMNGELFDKLNTTSVSSLTESLALEKALDYFGADIYKWQISSEEDHLKWEQEDPTATYFPKGELIFINEQANLSRELKLTYRFNIYAQQPFGRKEIYVDAVNGDVIWEENKIHEADVVGTAATGYSGTRTITSDDIGGGVFRLQETGRGLGIRTFNNLNTTTYSNTDFTNSSANWTTFTQANDAFATDAHWGSEMTYDYFLNEHNRNSIDGNGFRLDSYVHHDQNFANAFWDGTRMTYGDGNGNNSPFTALDIAGHEITHGLTSMTADLIYQDESGALNESFSDIFGVSVEFIARPAQSNWLLGEDLGFIIRDMANPNSQGDPHTYFGNNWSPLGGADNGGVHSNSGVQNFWYYLLVTGGSGTNDNGDAYIVDSIGLADAGKVAFRNLTVYLTPSSNYNDARFFGIQSAVDLFGGCTPRVEAVTNAWYAVGVGVPYSPVTISDFDAPLRSSCVNPLTVTFNNTSVNGSSFIWDFGDGNTSTQNSPTHTYTANGNYTVSLIADGGAACGIDTEIKPAYVNVDPSQPCVTVLPTNGIATTETACIGTIFDSGGPSGRYGGGEDVEITISPIGAGSIDLTFVSFDVEAGSASSCNFDYLEVYNGANTSAPLIARYCNNNIPTTVSSTSGSVTIVFHSDGGVEEDGFQIDWTCNIPTQAPLADFASNVDSTCTGEVMFTDISFNGPNTWAWDFGDGNSSTLQNPTHFYTASGTYSVQLTASNAIGNNVVVKNNFIVVDLPNSPTAQGDSICENNSANLSASGVGDLKWYITPLGGTAVSTGSTFVTPSINTTTTYYVEDAISAPLQSLGKTDNSGGGSNFSGSQYLIFDVFKRMEIVDVQVYPGSAGVRRIELRNSAGVILQSKVVAFNTTGQQTATLNFEIDPGTDYQLGLATTTPSSDLFRNNADVNYPYTLNGVASITRSTANANGGLNHYYFFYDWNVKEADCVSARTPVTAVVNLCTGIEDLTNDRSIKTYFNNFSNNIELSLNNLENGNYTMLVLNSLGQVVVNDKIVVTSDNQKEKVILNSQSKGVYFLKLVNKTTSYSAKFVK